MTQGGKCSRGERAHFRASLNGTAGRHRHWGPQMPGSRTHENTRRGCRIIQGKRGEHDQEDMQQVQRQGDLKSVWSAESQLAGGQMKWVGKWQEEARVYGGVRETCNEEFVSMAGGHRVGLGFRGESEGRQEAGHAIRQGSEWWRGSHEHTSEGSIVEECLASNRLSVTTMNKSGKSRAQGKKPDPEASPSFSKTRPPAGALTRCVDSKSLQEH